ncbi:hypothetical protein LNV23_05190 [Paucibacter sp. DJ1R-11]|uniref:ATP-binding protein n=1 Tax=Paucibacter sp. DJ1R-11 TaxID=2893556 RepID=UPI0021E3760A|nr:ATP-binding protein [Paucibacter sp. DJ1R-11]MCV2362844.1 hypothetical protein [Paucibacter sp. DJ1R-11]
MDFSVRDEVLKVWEAELDEPAWPLPISRRLALAWHLRQRDGRRARLLAEQARVALAAGPQKCAESPESAWLDLLDAELLLLQQIELLAAQRQAQLALAAFERLGDALGRCEAWLTLARVDIAQGRSHEAIASLGQATLAARAGGDEERAQVTELMSALFLTYIDPVRGRQHGAPSDAELAGMSPAVAAWAHELRGTLAAQASDYGHAAAERMSAMQLGLMTGQLSRAIAAGFNAADALNSLNEHELALQWMEKALALARQHELPLSTGHGLAQMGETLRRLGRLEPARSSLQDALQLLRRLPPGRNFCIALKYWADLCLDLDELEGAQAALAELLPLTLRQAHPDLHIHACRALAQLHSRQGQVAPALQLAQEALEGARQTGHVLRQIESLRALAELHSQHGLNGPAGEAPGQAALQLLEQALALAHSMAGYLVPGELFEALAEEHRKQGDVDLAYQLIRQASGARLKIQSDAANKRLLALQVLHQTERALAEAEHLRQLAEEQARRSEMLARTQAQLLQQERLASLGRLVAGVAHELNTPIGNCLLAASTWQERTLQLAVQAESRSMKRSDLERYFSDAEASADLLLRGLQRAAELVRQFKQLARDPGGEPLQRFAVLPLCQLMLAGFREAAAAAGIELSLEAPEAEIVLQGQPSALQQVLQQLLDNALIHAFVGRERGRLCLRLLPDGAQGPRLQVQDDGVGIAPEHLSRVFDPFFSTRFGQGGSGLGLHIAHHLATAVLGGSLEVQSELGQGSCFEICLPPPRVMPGE